MKHILLNISVLAVVLGGYFWAAPLCYGQGEALGQRLEQILRSPEFEGASVGVLAVSAAGDTLLQHDIHRELIPASNLKLVTTALALRNLGEDYRFCTSLGVTGAIDDGVLFGDVYIVGGGDPTFGSNNEVARPVGQVFEQWAAALRELGVCQIEGAIVADGRCFEGPMAHPSWQVEDLEWYYGAGASGLNFNENAFWEDKKGDSMANLYPEYTAAAEFYNYLMDNGIQCFEGVAEIGREGFVGVNEEGIRIICTEQSAPLSEIIKVTNYESNNVYAEALLKTLGLEFQGEGSYTCGAKAVKELLSDSDAIDVRGMKVVDGSGLSRVNHVSVATLCEVLMSMRENQAYVASLPYPGSESTVKNMLKSSSERDRIRMKSGSMGGVRGLSGYFLPINEEEMVMFSIVVNNYACSSAAMQKKMEEIILLLIR